MIFDELSFAKKMESNGFQKKMCKYELFIYAKYLKYCGKKPAQISNDLQEFCKKHCSYYNEIKHAKLIKSAILETKKYILRVPIEIHINKSEVDFIKNANNQKYKKILFVILIISKYFKTNNIKIKPKNPDDKKKLDDNYYYNGSIYDSVKIAKTYMTKQQRINMQYWFIQNNFLEGTPYGTFKVLFVDKFDESEKVLSIINYDDVSLYYNKGIGENIDFCDECGKIIKISNNRHKYCDECAIKIKQEQDRNADKKYKEKLKSEKIENA